LYGDDEDVPEIDIHKTFTGLEVETMEVFYEVAGSKDSNF
jgi:hypothetical protein